MRRALAIATLAAAGCSDPGSPSTPVVLDSTPAAVTHDTTASFSFHATVPADGFRCVLDVVHEAPCDGGTATYSGLAGGDHAFWVTARIGGSYDPLPAYYKWTVETAAPPAPVLVLPARVGNATTIMVTIRGVPGVARIHDGDCKGPLLASGPLTADSTGWKLDATLVVAADATTVLAAEIVDAGGASSPCVVASYREDSTPPTIQIVDGPVQPNGGGDQRLDFTVLDDGRPTSSYSCRLDGMHVTCEDGTLAIPNVYSPGRHWVQIEANDGVGNHATLDVPVRIVGFHGWAVLIGNDFSQVAAGDGTQAVLASSGNVLRYRGRASEAAVAGVDGVYSPFSIDDLSDPTALADRLPGHETLLVMDQELPPGDPALLALGEVWRTEVLELVGSGGRVVVLSGAQNGAASGTYQLLQIWGLLDVLGAQPHDGNGQVTSLYPISPALDHLILSPGSVAFTTPADSARPGVAYVSTTGGAFALARSLALIEDFEAERPWPWLPWADSSPSLPPSVLGTDDVLGGTALRGPGGGLRARPFSRPSFTVLPGPQQLRAHLAGDGSIVVAPFGNEQIAAELARDAGDGCALRVAAGWSTDVETVLTEVALPTCDGALNLVVSLGDGQEVAATVYGPDGARLGSVGPVTAPYQGPGAATVPWLYQLRGDVAIDDLVSD